MARSTHGPRTNAFVCVYVKAPAKQLARSSALSSITAIGKCYVSSHQGAGVLTIRQPRWQFGAWCVSVVFYTARLIGLKKHLADCQVQVSWWKTGFFLFSAYELRLSQLLHQLWNSLIVSIMSVEI